MFSIPDYRITKIKGEISLKKCVNSPINEQKEINQEDDQINDLKMEINKIKDTLNSLITQLYDKGLIE